MDGLGKQFQDDAFYLGSLEGDMIRMPMVFATKESYEKILEWGQNTSEEWYHPVSRSQFQSLRSIKEGDRIEFVLDGVSIGVEVLEYVTMYDYPLLKHVNGDFKISDLLAERVIRVKRV